MFTAFLTEIDVIPGKHRVLEFNDTGSEAYIKADLLNYCNPLAITTYSGILQCLIAILHFR